MDYKEMHAMNNTEMGFEDWGVLLAFISWFCLRTE